MTKKNKINISKDLMTKCNAIIHSASVAAGGVGTGMAQMPLADNAVITSIQVSMIIALGKVFDQNVSKSAAKAILGGMAASLIGRGVSQVLVGWIPGVGNVVNTATAAGITEAIGWTVVDNFSKNQYKDIIKEHPSNEEEKHAESTTTEESQVKDDLEKRASEFFSGKKNRKDNNKEFNELLNDIENKLYSVPDGDPLYELYDKLIEL